MHKVLIAEDEPITRQTIAKIMARMGYGTVQVANGRQALEILKLNSDFSLLLTDYDMPDMDGKILITEVRKTKVIQEIPIIMISGVIKLKEIDGILVLGASRFLPKPVNTEELQHYASSLIDSYSTKKVPPTAKSAQVPTSDRA